MFWINSSFSSSKLSILSLAKSTLGLLCLCILLFLFIFCRVFFFVFHLPCIYFPFLRFLIVSFPYSYIPQFLSAYFVLIISCLCRHCPLSFKVLPFGWYVSHLCLSSPLFLSPFLHTAQREQGQPEQKQQMRWRGTRGGQVLGGNWSDRKAKGDSRA